MTPTDAIVGRRALDLHLQDVHDGDGQRDEQQHRDPLQRLAELHLRLQAPRALRQLGDLLITTHTKLQLKPDSLNCAHSSNKTYRRLQMPRAAAIRSSATGGAKLETVTVQRHRTAVARRSAQLGGVRGAGVRRPALEPMLLDLGAAARSVLRERNRNELIGLCCIKC